MALATIQNLVSDKDPTPNKFKIGMGELIRKAREEAGISQVELARLISRRQATLSDIENGKIEVSSGTLVLLAAALEKPIVFFYPPIVYKELKQEEFTPDEQELISVFRNIWSNKLRMLAVQILRNIANFDPQDMFIDSFDIISGRIDQEGLTKLFLDAKNKRKEK